MPAIQERSANSPGDLAPSASLWQRLPYRWPFLSLTLLILILGAVEDLYGNTDSGDVYGSDAVQYLDLARAIARHDWHSVLNPLWSQGYPTLLTIVHLAFRPNPAGDWWTTRTTNFLIFALGYAAFLYLLATLFSTEGKSARETGVEGKLPRIALCLLLFAAMETCLGQVSRVNPDELVTAFFLLSCAQLVGLHRRALMGRSPSWKASVAFGLTLGVGFLLKTVFLPLGAGILAIAAVSLWRSRLSLRPLLCSIALFVFIVGSYSAALSHTVGYATVGEAGAINYAWHVNRLQKWVHWEGGTQAATEAWPKASIARFAQWSTRPPDFGTPIHPSAILQRSPTVYSFAAPVHATYAPYLDPPYFYRGYRHLFRARYQLIALAKSLGDLLQVLIKQPVAWALVFGLLILLRTAPARRTFAERLRKDWPLLACSGFGILYYLPVHLEGRYLAGMFLVLGTCTLLAAPEPRQPQKGSVATAFLLLGLLLEIAAYQSPVWRNLLRGKKPQNNPEWQMGLAALGQHLAPDAPIGVIAWTPNLHSDWAYIAHLQITSEIASGPDYDQFWHLPPDRQAATLQTFHRAGAIAVFVNSKPPGLGGPEWHQLNGTPLWMTRFQ